MKLRNWFGFLGAFIWVLGYWLYGHNVPTERGIEALIYVFCLAAFTTIGFMVGDINE